MPELEHARQLLTLARRDLQASGGMLDRFMFADEVFGFHAQQSAEKAFKAWLSLRDVKYPHLHDLKMLCHLLEEAGEASVSSFVHLADLTDFAVQYRYDFFDDEPIDRPSVLQSVEALVSFVEARLRETESLNR
jgi:HEPN domain-containing protein